jgi:hypothetical protein
MTCRIFSFLVIVSLATTAPAMAQNQAEVIHWWI